MQRFQVAGPPASPFDAPKLRLDALWVSPADELRTPVPFGGPSQAVYRHLPRAKSSAIGAALALTSSPAPSRVTSASLRC